MENAGRHPGQAGARFHSPLCKSTCQLGCGPCLHLLPALSFCPAAAPCARRRPAPMPDLHGGGGRHSRLSGRRLWPQRPGAVCYQPVALGGYHPSGGTGLHTALVGLPACLLWSVLLQPHVFVAMWPLRRGPGEEAGSVPGQLAAR